MATSDFIFQGFQPRSHASALERALKLKVIQHGILSAAFVNEGGVEILASHIAPVAKNLVVYAGIRNDITSRQGLEALLKLGVKLYAVDTGSRRLIFHPKIYLTRSKEAAHVIIGSANFTAGGLNNNIEGSVVLDLEMANAADAKLCKSIEDQFAALPGKYPKHVIHITGKDVLAKMHEEGRLLDESEVEPPKPIAVKKGSGTGDGLERITLALKPIWRKVKKPSKPATPKPAPKKEEEGEAVEPSIGVGFEFVWESKALTERDLTIPKDTATTHPTGSINLDKGTMAAEVDHRHYFRDEVFNALTWAATKSAAVEAAHATFQLVIKGTNYGEFTLRISHTTSTDTTSYKQRNAMTRLSWGPIRKYVAQEEFIGRTVLLYRDTNDPTRFLLEID